ncbi:MAG: hypothetical protein JWO88_951 [Frankiales bacterium]|nr:hypothetical protein [Frankiales bacterium]
MTVLRLPRGPVVQLALLGCFIAGCGTTVSSAAQQQNGVLTDGGLGVGSSNSGTTNTGLGGRAGPGDGAAASVAGQLSGGSGPAVASIGGSRDTSATSGTSGSSASIGAGPQAKTRGVTANTITVGFTYLENASAANAAIGAGGMTNGHEPQEVALLAADINSHGGLAGRKLVVLYHAVDATKTGTPPAVQTQAECDYWTQDHSVFAVISSSPFAYAAKPCLEKRGLIYLSGYMVFADDDMVKRRLTFDLAAMSFDRFARAVPAALSDGGWYAGWDTQSGRSGTGSVKTGILYYENLMLDRVVKQIMIPRMRQAGHAPDQADVITVATGSDAGASAIQGAILKFRSDGVTHVVLPDMAGVLTLLFANGANSQHYYPRMGGGSGNAFQLLLQNGSVQPASVNGAVAAGWFPINDLPYSSSKPPAQTTPAFADCMKRFNAWGITFGDANAAAVAAGHCDEFNVLGQAFRHIATPSNGAFVAAADGLSQSLTPAEVTSWRFTANRHDPTSGYYLLVYDGSRQVMTYKGKLRPI